MRLPRPVALRLAVLLLALPAAALGQGRRFSPAVPLEPADQLQSPNAECCLILLLPVGARAVALGGATVARTSPDAVFANPAGLAGIAANELVLHYTASVAGQTTAVSLLFTPAVVGTLGASYQLVDHGEIEQTDETGQSVGSLSLRHHVLVASFGTVVTGGLAAGLNYKLYQFRIGCRGACRLERRTATTHAVDAGIRYVPERLPALQLGAAVTSVGFALQVVNAEQADPLPTRVRLGAAYEVLRHLQPDSTVALWVAVELADRWRDPGSPQASLGLELAASEAVFLRAGYTYGDGLETGGSVGLGLRYARFTVAIAKSFVPSVLDPEEEPLQLTFGMSF
ncbi:MAG: PorV/PorQ family protein [Gemmatimonadetes bacterium]|nr:PorV/PorQ family protein [Gemmatimonadota bacterium]